MRYSCRTDSPRNGAACGGNIFAAEIGLNRERPLACGTLLIQSGSSRKSAERGSNLLTTRLGLKSRARLGVRYPPRTHRLSAKKCAARFLDHGSPHMRDATAAGSAANNAAAFSFLDIEGRARFCVYVSRPGELCQSRGLRAQRKPVHSVKKMARGFARS